MRERVVGIRERAARGSSWRSGRGSFPRGTLATTDWASPTIAHRAAYNSPMSVTAGERRIVSVLVADVAGSTSIAERLGPERSKFLFDDVVRLMREEVERFGGTVAQLTGDGVLALFGAPVAHEDDSERAVRAAFAIREAVDAYAAEVGPAYGVELRARVAVNTGPVVVPSGDAPADVLYNALGDTVNVAARLQALGDLVVGPVDGTPDRRAVRARGARRSRAQGQERDRYRISRDRRVRAQQPRPYPEPPLVGRAQELGELSDALDGLLRGEGRDRIHHRRARDRQVAPRRRDGQERLRRSRSASSPATPSPYAETIPYWPVREQLRGWLGLGVSDSEARVRIELRAELARTLGDEAEEAYPFLATLLGLTLEPEQEQRLRRLRARRRPAPDVRLALPARLRARSRAAAVPRARGSPLVGRGDARAARRAAACGRSRQRSASCSSTAVTPITRPGSSSTAPAGASGASFLELELEPLPDVDTRALAEAGRRRRAARASSRSSSRSGPAATRTSSGEAIRDLRERGVLERENGRLVLVGEPSIPAALQETLQARIDRLDAEARELVTTAAVIGRSFGLPLLERLLPRARLRRPCPSSSGSSSSSRSGAAARARVPLPARARPGGRVRHDSSRRAGVSSTCVSVRRSSSSIRDSPAEVVRACSRTTSRRRTSQSARSSTSCGRATPPGRSTRSRRRSSSTGGRSASWSAPGTSRGPGRRCSRSRSRITSRSTSAPPTRRSRRRSLSRRPALCGSSGTSAITWAAPAAWRSRRSHRASPGATSRTGSRVNLFRGLVAIGRDFEIEPDLAERFTVSDDGLTYRFTLRGDARWSDGEPVTADDFAFTFAQMVEDEVEAALWLDGVSASASTSGRSRSGSPSRGTTSSTCSLSRALFAWPRHVYERRGTGLASWTSRSSGTARSSSPSRDDERASCSRRAPSLVRGARQRRRGTIELEASPTVAADRWRGGDYDVLDDVLAAAAAVADDETVVRALAGDDRRGTSASTRGDRRSTTSASVVRSRMRSTGRADRRASASNRGRSGRAASADDAGAFASRRPVLRPRTRPRPPQRSGHPDGRGLGEIVLTCLDLWEDVASDMAAQLAAIGVRVRLSVRGLRPRAGRRDREHGPRLHLGLGLPTPPIRAAASSSRCSAAATVALPRRAARGAAGRRLSLHDQDERLRTYREFERIWIGEHAAVVPLAYADRLLWRRPWVTGMWANAIARSTFAEAVVRPDLRSARRRG